MDAGSAGSNPAGAPFPDDVCIHHLFEKQALKHSDKVAVILEDKRLTYGELNQKANQLAHHLQKLGVNQGTPVGLFLERSVEVITGIFGILKAGVAYDNQDIPFEMVAGALVSERDTSRNPIFQVSFILQNTPQPFIRSAGLNIFYDEVGNNTSKLDLLLNLEERKGHLEGWFEYNTDIFSPVAVE